MAADRKWIDWNDPILENEIFRPLREQMWTPEQEQSFAKHFQLIPKMKLLDAGCGHGYSLRHYARFVMPGGELIGLDAEATLLHAARQRASHEGLDEVARFVKGDIAQMPFAENAFDITMAQLVMCHLDEPEEALSEMIRVTKAGGCVVIFDNAVAETVPSWSEPQLRSSLEERLFAHEMELRMHEGRKALGKHGLEIGCHMPALMEAHGLVDVDARCNERVTWIAPPYRSRFQQPNLERVREWCAKGNEGKIFEHSLECARAGGASEKMIDRFKRKMQEGDQQFLSALEEGRCCFSSPSGTFWCIWGFKPI